MIELAAPEMELYDRGIMAEDYKPSDLFIGVVDFFAILLPGSLLCFFLLDFAPKIFDGIFPKIEGEMPRWVAFAVVAYISGHFLLAIGTAWDFLYDSTYRKYKRKKEGDLRDYVKPLLTGYDGYSEIGDELRWATAYVRARSGAAASEIDAWRLTANRSVAYQSF